MYITRNQMIHSHDPVAHSLGHYFNFKRYQFLIRDSKGSPSLEFIDYSILFNHPSYHFDVPMGLRPFRIINIFLSIFFFFPIPVTI